MKPRLITLGSARCIPARLMLGCAEEETPEIDCSTASVPHFSEVSIWPKCTNCHASTLTGADRFGAPVGIDYDTYDTAVQYADLAMEEVAEGAMPYPDGTGVTEAEKTSLYTWVQCGTPE